MYMDPTSIMEEIFFMISVILLALLAACISPFVILSACVVAGMLMDLDAWLRKRNGMMDSKPVIQIKDLLRRHRHDGRS